MPGQPTALERRPAARPEPGRPGNSPTPRQPGRDTLHLVDRERKNPSRVRIPRGGTPGCSTRGTSAWPATPSAARRPRPPWPPIRAWNAEVNMDGTFFTPIPQGGLGGRPFLMLAGDPALLPPDVPDTSWEDNWPRLDGRKRWLTVTGAGHPAFTDRPVLGDQAGYPHPGHPLRAPGPSRSRGRTSVSSSTCTCAGRWRRAWTARRAPTRRSCSTAAEDVRRGPQAGPRRPRPLLPSEDRAQMDRAKSLAGWRPTPLLLRGLAAVPAGPGNGPIAVTCLSPHTF